MTDVLDRVKTYQQFIGGQWVDAASGETLDVENPANGQVIANVPASREGGRRPGGRTPPTTAFQTWQQTTPQDRSLALLKIADIARGNGRRARPARVEPTPASRSAPRSTR